MCRMDKYCILYVRGREYFRRYYPWNLFYKGEGFGQEGWYVFGLVRLIYACDMWKADCDNSSSHWSLPPSLCVTVIIVDVLFIDSTDFAISCFHVPCFLHYFPNQVSKFEFRWIRVFFSNFPAPLLPKLTNHGLFVRKKWIINFTFIFFSTLISYKYSTRMQIKLIP